MHINTTVEEECELRNFLEHQSTHNTRTIKLISRIVLRILQAAEKEADYQAEQNERQDP